MRRALMVGIDDYPSAPLSGCVRDATAVQELVARHDDGSPNFDCRLMTAPPDDITRTSLRQALDDLLRSPAELAFFFFSGHGTENNLEGYLVTQDAQRYDEGVPMTELLSLANNSPVPEVVIMLDCCHSGALGQVPAVNNDRAMLRHGISVLTASRSNEAALESGGAGVFTSLVCAALEGEAADVMGRVTAAGVYTFVDQALGPWSQRPLFKAHVSRMTSLRTCAPAVEPAILRRLPEWFPDSTAEFPLDPSYEPEATPHDTDHESVFALLQKCRATKLLEPVGEEHMYFAAMRSKSCRLTALGRYYWRLANEGRI